jgi:hypothetical protein
MKTLLAFLRKSGRNIRRHINRLVTLATRNGSLKIGVTVSVPPFIKVSIDYAVKLAGEKAPEEKT